MRLGRTTTVILIACATIAAAVVIVRLATGGGPPESLASAATPKAGGPPPAWVFTRSKSSAEPIAITTDPHGRAYVLALHDNLNSADWDLLREGADGLLHRIARQGSRFPSRDIDHANVAIGADGAPIVVWTGRDGKLYADIGGHQSLVAHGEAPLGRSTDVDPALVATGDGGAILAWNSGLPAQFNAWIAERRLGQSTFGPPRRLGTSYELPTVLAERNGGATVVWNDQGVVRAMTRARGGAFGAPIEIGGDAAHRASAAIGRDGRIVVTWWDPDHGVQAVQRPVGKREFDKPVTLFGTSGVSDYPDVGIDDRGRATIAWVQQTDDMVARSDESEAAVSQWPAGGKPGTPRHLTSVDPRHQFDPRVLATPVGSVVVIGSTLFRPDNAHPDLAVTADGRRVVLAGTAGYPVYSSGASGLVGAWPGGTGDEQTEISLGRLHQ